MFINTNLETFVFLYSIVNKLKNSFIKNRTFCHNKYFKTKLNIFFTLNTKNINFFQKFIYFLHSSIGSLYSMMMFGWSRAKTVTYTSIAQGVIGLLTLIVYIF